MFEIELPAIPAGVLVLLAFFGPYAVSALNAVLPFVKKPWQRKLVSIAVAVALAVVVVVVYFLFGGTIDGLNIGALVVISVLILSASYALVTKPSASAVEAKLSR